MLKWIRHFIAGQEPALTSPTIEIDNSTVPDTEQEIDQYVADQPITSVNQDRFNRAKFATRIAETIATRVDPASIVLGLYGPWGDGKTSVLEMMHESLQQLQSVILIRFNPWHFQTSELLLKGFFATLAEAMGKSLPNFKEKAGNLLQNYGSLLSLASFTVGGIVQLRPGDAIKGVGDTMSSVSLDELRRRIETMLDEAGKRVVILIDDIDRLDRDETHAIFKLVKLSASFRYTSYVLAFDDAVVAAALGERYGADGMESGRAFLEKIIQVPLHLPPADGLALRELVFEGVESALRQAKINLQQSQIDTLLRHFIVGLEPRLETPRRAKLYTNALTFALPILKGEVDPVDLMLIEGIRVFYPRLYAGIRDNQDLFVKGERESRGNGEPDKLDQLLNESMSEFPESERQNVREGLLINLFPRTKKNTMYDESWNRIWDAGQKICSTAYFKRYFSYGIPIADISDVQIVSLAEDVVNADDSQKRAILTTYSDQRAMSRLISKLRQRVKNIQPREAFALMTAIAKNADLLPRERGMMVWVTTMMQGAMLMADLLRQVDGADLRQLAAEQLIDIAAPLGFAVECINWIRHHESRPEADRVLLDTGEARIGAILARRIKAIDDIQPIFTTYPKDAISAYFALANTDGDENVKDRLTTHFDANPESVDMFLGCFIGEAWAMDTGLPHPSDFSRNNYDNLSRLVSPVYIAENLRQRFGGELDDPQRFPQETMNQTRRVAHQYMSVHQVAQNEQQSSTPAPEN